MLGTRGPRARAGKDAAAGPIRTCGCGIKGTKGDGVVMALRDPVVLLEEPVIFVGGAQGT